jgi:L-lactate dehydrogenase complex protein LldG
MSASRTFILEKIKQNQAGPVPLPQAFIEGIKFENKAAQFKLILESIGAKVIFVKTKAEVEEGIKLLFPEARYLISTDAAWGNIPYEEWLTKDPHGLAEIDVSILESRLGVAENGAVWLSESDLGQRVSAFINQYLVLYIEEEHLVNNLHEAYEMLEQNQGFGLWLAGPSKTADIEQSLVLGAHGARGLTVFLKKKD